MGGMKPFGPRYPRKCSRESDGRRKKEEFQGRLNSHQWEAGETQIDAVEVVERWRVEVMKSICGTAS